MQLKIALVLFCICVFSFSCETPMPINNATSVPKIESDSSATIHLKPLSTEKTHEGGVDHTKLEIK